jgi:hypothetical protein
MKRDSSARPFSFAPDWRIHFCVLAAFCLSAMTQRGAAALSWEALAVDRVAELGAPSIEIVFRFKNAGNAPVTITSVQTSCGCTSTALTKKDYAPGESGELTVMYRFAGQVGPQEKIVTVTTSDAPDRPTLLALRVKIPELFSVSPRLLWWSVGEAAVEKQTAITINPALQATVSQLPPDNPAFSARLVARPGEHDYVLSIVPVSTKAALRASVNLRIMASGFAPQIVTVYALVR